MSLLDKQKYLQSQFGCPMLPAICLKAELSMSLEVELKFLLPVQGAETLFTSLLQTLSNTCQFKAEHTLLNAYFDTADGWFRRHDMGLRTRQKNQQFEQTIKLAGVAEGAAHIRPEYNLPVASVQPVLADSPAQIWPAGAEPQMLQQQLAELFRTDFVRRSFLLHEGSSELELVFDQGQVLAGGEHEAIAELELELQHGELADVLAVARRLLQNAPLLLGVQSKAERGYRLAQRQPLQAQAFDTQASLASQLRWFLCQQILHSQGTISSAELEQNWLVWQTQLQHQQHPLALVANGCDATISATARQLWLLDLTASLITASLATA